MTEQEKIDREFLISHTIHLMNKDVPKISNKKGVKELISAHFSRTDPGFYDLFDAFFFSIIEGVCLHLESRGVKRPSAADFISSFRQVQGININIGNLKIDNSTPTDEFRDSIIQEVLERLKNPPIEEDKKDDEQEEDDITDELEKYKNFGDNNGNDKETQ